MKNNEDIQHEMERRLFKTGLSASVVTVGILLLIDLFYLKDYRSVMVELFGLLCFSIFIYFSTSSKYNSKLIFPFLILIFALLNLGWFVGGGFAIPIALLFIVGISLSLILISKEHRLLVLVAFTLNYLALMIVEYFNTEIRLIFEDKVRELYVSYIFIGITYSLSIYLIVYMKDNYEKVREKLTHLNTRLNLQAADLLDINEKLELANKLLEKKVEQRTLKVEEQKKKILDYAFMNSHHVRAPLVNILGLTSLYQSSKLNAEEQTYVFEKLKKAADQLNLEFEMVKGHIEKEEWTQKN